MSAQMWSGDRFEADVPGSNPSYWSPWWMDFPDVESRPGVIYVGGARTARDHGVDEKRDLQLIYDPFGKTIVPSRLPSTKDMDTSMYSCCSLCAYLYLCSADSEITGHRGHVIGPTTATELVCIRHIAFIVYTGVWARPRNLQRYAASIKQWSKKWKKGSIPEVGLAQRSCLSNTTRRNPESERNDEATQCRLCTRILYPSR